MQTAISKMGEAEFARGNYRASQRDFQRPRVQLAPDDPGVRRQLDRCNEVLQLDPPAERTQRLEERLSVGASDWLNSR